MTMEATAKAIPRASAMPRTVTVAIVLALVMTTGGLVIYKAASALKVLAGAHADHALRAKARWIDVADTPAATRALLDSLNYLAWVGIALAFGIVIAATVRAFVPGRWLERAIRANGVRGQLVAALVGAPLMLCSCCVAPVFEGVYARTRRLGPSLGIMLAAPALNPAVIAATFFVFPISVASLRLGGAVLLVLVAALVLARANRDPRPAEACPLEVDAPSLGTLARAFVGSLASVARRSLPAILIGVAISMAIAGWIPLDAVARDAGHAVVIVVAVALVAVPLALPTFGEIPLALALLAAGAPAGAAAALLVAGPTVNLPSLLSLARATSWRVAAGTAGAVFTVAVAVGLAVLAIE
jgi:hypothetical protein